MKQSSRPIFVYPSVIAVAIYYAVLGYLTPVMRVRFSLTLAEAGLFLTMQSAGFIVSLLLCFSVYSALNKPRVMAASLLALSFCLAGLAITPSMFVLCALFFFSGVFLNTIDTLSNAVMADLAPGLKSRNIGLLQALFSGVGAVAPYFALLLGNDYATVFLALGAFALASFAVFALGLRSPMRQPWLINPQGFGTVGKMVRLFKVRGVPAVMILGFLGMFVQVAFIYFLSSYVTDVTKAADSGAFAVCMLYTGALLGRLVYVYIARRFGTYRILLAYNALAVLGIAAMLLTRDITAMGLLALLPGFGLSANFPGLMVKACNLVPDDTSAAAALIFFGDNSAAFIAPPVVGAVGDTANLSVAFALCAALLVPVIAAAAVFSYKAAHSANVPSSQSQPAQL